MTGSVGIWVEVLLHTELSSYDNESIVAACQRLEKTFNNFIKITFKESTLDLSSFDILKTPVTVNGQRMLHGESLLEELVKISVVNIEILALTSLILYKEKGSTPIAMFCYDVDQKKASIVISVDELRSPDKAQYTRNVSIYLMHEIGELVVGKHCKNQSCPLCFQPCVNKTEKCQEVFCKKCFRMFTGNVMLKFNYMGKGKDESAKIC